MENLTRVFIVDFFVVETDQHGHVGIRIDDCSLGLLTAAEIEGMRDYIKTQFNIDPEHKVQFVHVMEVQS